MSRKRAKIGPRENSEITTTGSKKDSTGSAACRGVNETPFWSSPRASLFAMALIIASTVAVYCNSFGGPFIFDDSKWILENASIRDLASFTSSLWPNQANSTNGRPLISLTLAVNYAMGGTHVWGYHAMNLAIHILAALTLFGVVRRTLILPDLRDRFGGMATPLALAIAVLWAVHPLQTQAVTYIIQRCESLMGLFYLLTLYCVIRSNASDRPMRWSLAAVVACCLGMATKEVMASAPFVVLLYDRTFLSGSFRSALQKRYRLYLALAGSWGVMAWLLVTTGFQSPASGFAVATSTWWSYLLTQSGVLVHYLRLAFWPTGLCLDYAWPPANTFVAIVPPSLVIVGLLVLTGWTLVKHPAIGFLGAWFFLILAPSSSILPIADMAFEHRMYLSLEAVITSVVFGVVTLGGWLVCHGHISLRVAQLAGCSSLLLMAIALGVITFDRNADYRSALSIWQDTANKMPNNARALNNLGVELVHIGQIDEAILLYEKALKIAPEHAGTYNNWGQALAARGEYESALAYYQKAVELKPHFALFEYNTGAAYSGMRQLDHAIACYERALECDSHYADAYNGLGAAYMDRGQTDKALLNYQKAVDANPSLVDAHFNLAAALAALARYGEAVTHYREVVQREPQSIDARNNLAILLATCPETSVRNGDEALALAKQAVELSHGEDPRILDTLATVYAETGQFNAAVQTARKALELALRRNQPALVDGIQIKLRCYETKKPFRATPSP